MTLVFSDKNAVKNFFSLSMLKLVVLLNIFVETVILFQDTLLKQNLFWIDFCLPLLISIHLECIIAEKKLISFKF